MMFSSLMLPHRARIYSEDETSYVEVSCQITPSAMPKEAFYERGYTIKGSHMLITSEDMHDILNVNCKVFWIDKNRTYRIATLPATYTMGMIADHTSVYMEELTE